MTASSVRTTVTEVTEETGSFVVTIGMNNSISVTSRGGAGTPLRDVINDAIVNLGLTGSDAEIIGNDGSLRQNVFVNNERVEDLEYNVSPGSSVFVDKRKSNG